MNKIPLDEFKRRQKAAQQKVRERGLDALLVHSHEADYANVRYFSDYWPIFESAGLLIQSHGDPVLIIGPESETFARDHSVIPNIKKILYYREAAEPDYPDIVIDTFEDVFRGVNDGRGVKRLGIAGWTAMPVSVYEAVKAALPGAEIVKADDILHELRTIKSQVEIDILQEGFRATEFAVKGVLDNIKPGMTELQVVGFAEQSIYEHGGEYEAHPVYILSGVNSSHAIGRPGYRVIEKGDLVQINVGARIAGYSPSIGVPVCVGKMNPKMKDLVSFGLEAHLKTMDWMKAGIPARETVIKFVDFVTKRGYAENLLYGPCHGLGMIEVERPWMESTSEYLLQENMTFQVDTFLYCKEFGLRWEVGVRVTKDGVEPFSTRYRDIIEL